jgi:phasin family protein
MATKNAAKSPSSRKSTGAAKRTPRSASSGQGGARTQGGAEGAGAARAARAFAGMTDAAQLAKLKEMMTPEQAFELYRQNTRLALDIIDAAIESTAKMRRLQFEGEEQARDFQKRAARRAAEAENPQALVATGQNVGQEAVQKALAYWSQMFELVVEMQKRLFNIIDDQVKDVPGVKQAKEAMKMLPDFTQTEKLVNAMQGVLSSGGSAFESMQKVMSDFTRMAQQSMPGGKR